MKEMEVLAKIQNLLNSYFQGIGREEIESTEEARIELINDIDYALEEIKIPSKYLIMEKIKEDEKEEKMKYKCDECGNDITQTDWLKNKGLCEDCSLRIQ